MSVDLGDFVAQLGFSIGTAIYQTPSDITNDNNNLSRIYRPNSFVNERTFVRSQKLSIFANGRSLVRRNN